MSLNMCEVFVKRDVPDYAYLHGNIKMLQKTVHNTTKAETVRRMAHL